MAREVSWKTRDRRIANVVTLALLVAYSGAVLALGLFAFRRSRRTAEDYFLASRSVGLWLLVGTVVATIVNSLAVTGTPALLYEGGVLFAQMFVAVSGAMALMWFFGPRVCKLGKEQGAITQGDVFFGHYQSRTVLAASAFLGILAVFPFLAIQLAGIGKVLSATTRGAIGQEFAVLLCALSIGLYLVLGGARAAVWTDALQGLIALAFFAGSALLFSNWGEDLATGVETLRQVMPEKLVFTRDNTPPFFDGVLSWTFAFFLWPHVFQRMLMGRTPQSVRRMASVSFVVFNFLLICLLVMAIMSTAELYGSLEDPDRLLAVMFERHTTHGGVFLTLVTFALGMSTVDSMLLALSSTVSRDLWEGLLHGSRPSSGGLARGRWITLAFLALAALFAITAIGRGAIVPWVTLGASIATLLLWPFLGMFLGKRVSATGVLTAMGLGLLAICTTRFTDSGDALPFGYATAGFLVGGASFLVAWAWPARRARRQPRPECRD